MNDATRFLSYCVEIYKNAKHLTGREVIDLFEKTGAIDYLAVCHEALHTTGPQYTVNDIDAFISDRYHE
jgi:hypothetical protein